MLSIREAINLEKINLKTFLNILLLNYSKDIGVTFTKQRTNQNLNNTGGKQILQKHFLVQCKRKNGQRICFVLD